MFSTVWAVVREGKIEPLEQVDLPEGSKVLVTLISEEDGEFWAQASQGALDVVWDNSEDEVYARLHEK